MEKPNLSKAELQMLRSIDLALSCVNSYSVDSGIGQRVNLGCFQADLFCLLHEIQQSLYNTFNLAPVDERITCTRLVWEPSPKANDYLKG